MTKDPQCIHRTGCIYATACHRAGHCTSTTHSRSEVVSSNTASIPLYFLEELSQLKGHGTSYQIRRVAGQALEAINLLTGELKDTRAVLAACNQVLQEERSAHETQQPATPKKKLIQKAEQLELYAVKKWYFNPQEYPTLAGWLRELAGMQPSETAGDAKHEYVDCPKGTGCPDCFGWCIP